MWLVSVTRGSRKTRNALFSTRDKAIQFITTFKPKEVTLNSYTGVEQEYGQSFKVDISLKLLMQDLEMLV